MSELSNPIPVRLQKKTDEELRDISRKTSVPFSVLIRIAVQYGLPELKKTLNPTKTMNKPFVLDFSTVEYPYYEY